MRFLVIFSIIFNQFIFPQEHSSVITGTVVNSIDNSPIQGCSILIKEELSRTNNFTKGTTTDPSGSFMIEPPIGNYILTANYLGFKTFEKKIVLSKKNNIVDVKISLSPVAYESKEITITGERKNPTTISQEIEEKDLQRMPNLYGDVMRSVQILPGVVSNNELSSGYNVRGGNFDDNLIYLNGFEIYRPFLLRQGVEENQTLINPDLANELRFYNGSFPASYGDKMSSALEVNYNINKADKLSGTVKTDLLNAGVSFKNKFENLKVAGAMRYAYPGFFLSALQTNGEYKPFFTDIQVLANYTFNNENEIEAFILYADNKFDLTPTDWIGSFGGFQRDDIRQIEIYYEGERKYSFKTGLIGLKYISQLSDETVFKLSAARYSTVEDEFSDLIAESYYRADKDAEREFLKTGIEDVNNNLNLTSYEFIPQLQIKNDSHLFTAGFNIRLTDVHNIMNEHFTENGDSVIYDFPFDRVINQKYDLNSYSGFIQDEFNIARKFLFNAGVRLTYYHYNKELMTSPRINFIYLANPLNTITVSWGYYFQPPYYAELRNKTDVTQNKLKAQRAIHYSFGWEYQFKEKLKLNIEAYYKDLFNLIPYYIDREKTEYLDANTNEGFAYGFDVMVQGEIVEGMNSWLGYGYLNTQERKANSGETYHRRLTDNNHSIQIFLQDKIKKHPNWQAHLRMLFNTGYVFSLRRFVTDEETGRRYIKVIADEVRDYPAMYFRVDMGLSASFDVGTYKLVAVVEVLNLFNHRNFGSYRFMQVSKDIKSPFAVPQVLSSRFLNVGVELKF